mgnify:FL=1
MELLTMNRFEKAAIEVIQPFVKNKITHIIPEKSRNSVLSLDEAKTLAEAMDASARYGALNDTQVHLNGAKITGFQNRAVENKRNTGWAKMMAGMSDPFANMPDKSKNVPDAFFPNHDAVWLPSGNPGIMMHELGHAADMNEFPNTPFRRFVAGTYQNFSPTLWKEHAAWIKGKNRLIEGAAKTKVDPNLVVRTLEDAARVKPVGLGSYWGGGLGAIMGGGLGFAAALKGAPPQASALGLVLGASAGALTGLQLGKMYGNSDRLGSEKSKQGYLDLYANQYAKEHGITLDKAKIELNNFIKAKKKPSTIRKAASFGGMFSSKFTPDRKLQQALMAEREKLMDVWEEGGTDWSPETHPDMGGNPDFDRRWSKAFNEKKEVEPRVIKGIPYPLYGSKPSWFPFRTQGMIDKAREAEYVRGDNEDAWDENDWKTERALQSDRTREGVNNILNHYLDRHHGIVKNPYRHPADLEYIDGPHADYKGIVQKSLPWNTTADTDKVNELADETMFPDYKSPANRQKLFDQYYPYLDLAPSAKPSKKGPIAKAAAFGAMMGKRAVALNPMVLSSLAGAAIGGGGTAIYDWLKGTKENKLRRAMIGAGVGGLAGAGLGHLAGKLSPVSKLSGGKPKSDDSSSDFERPTEAEMDEYYRQNYKNYYPKEPRPVDLDSIPEFEGRPFQSELDDANANLLRANVENNSAKADLAKEESKFLYPYFSGPQVAKIKENIIRTGNEKEYYGEVHRQIKQLNEFPMVYPMKKEGPFVTQDGHIREPRGRDDGEFARTIGKITYKD